MKARFSRLALGDLEAILTHIAAENPEAAARLALRVYRVVERIERFPMGGQAVTGHPEIRRIPFVRYPYALYYRVHEGEVVILRILHGARRQPWEPTWGAS